LHCNTEAAVAPEVHPTCADISGIVVHADPHCIAPLCAALERIAGITVHAVGSAGKIVVTIETENETRSLERLEAVRALDGVQSVAMVYHRIETDPDQEV
jgi:nitrate reductase NapAB chaperone NapD